MSCVSAGQRWTSKRIGSALWLYPKAPALLSSPRFEESVDAALAAWREDNGREPGPASAEVYTFTTVYDEETGEKLYLSVDPGEGHPRLPELRHPSVSRLNSSTLSIGPTGGELH